MIVILTGADRTLGESNPVTGRISLLISFILSAYITITVNRWDRIRNGTLGSLYTRLPGMMVTYPVLCIEPS
jgi:hypothetical protein